MPWRSTHGSRTSASGTTRIARTTTRGSTGSSTTAERSCGAAPTSTTSSSSPCPDSLTLVSTSANLRLESYLFTSEAFDEVRDRLSPDGVFVLYNFYREEWLPKKIGGMLEDSFGSPPIVRQYEALALTFAAGPLISSLDGGSPPGEAAEHLDLSAAPAAATDDWPFLYLRDRFIAPYYILALSIIIAFAVLHRWARGRPKRDVAARLQPPFLRARRGLPPPRDEEPRDLQPAVRNDVARQCARVLCRARKRPAGHRRQPSMAVPEPGIPVRGALWLARRSRSCSRRRPC